MNKLLLALAIGAMCIANAQAVELSDNWTKVSERVGGDTAWVDSESILIDYPSIQVWVMHVTTKPKTERGVTFDWQADDTTIDCKQHTYNVIQSIFYLNGDEIKQKQVRLPSKVTPVVAGTNLSQVESFLCSAADPNVKLQKPE